MTANPWDDVKRARIRQHDALGGLIAVVYIHAFPWGRLGGFSKGRTPVQRPHTLTVVNTVQSPCQVNTHQRAGPLQGLVSRIACSQEGKSLIHAYLLGIWSADNVHMPEDSITGITGTGSCLGYGQHPRHVLGLAPCHHRIDSHLLHRNHSVGANSTP
ncbi:hypothetical protein ES703_106897 [subsurface metagenome]